MEATIPELGSVHFCGPKSSSFSGSDSIVVEEAPVAQYSGNESSCNLQHFGV